MSFTLAVVVFVVAIIVAILIHEAGHLLVAKIFDFKVEEYFVGFGPKLWSFKRGETEYGVKAIPAGGYVKIAGMNPYQPPPEEDLPRTYGEKPIWQRALVIVAGPVTHVVVAFVLFALYVGAVGLPRYEAVIDRVEPTMNGEVSPAQAAGLRGGDVIAGVGEIRDPSVTQLSDYTAAHLNTPMSLTIRRADREFTVTVTPVTGPGEGNRPQPRIGFIISDRLVGREREGVVGSVVQGARLTGSGVAGVGGAFAKVFSPNGLGRIVGLVFGNERRGSEDAVSIIGAARAAGQAGARSGLAELLPLIAMINLFIGMLNLIPLPPFDGGHLAVLAVEKVRGRKVDIRKLVRVSAAVLSFFVLLTLAAAYLDIFKPIDLLP